MHENVMFNHNGKDYEFDISDSMYKSLGHNGTVNSSNNKINKDCLQITC